MADELKASPQEPITGALAKALGWMAHPTVDGHEIKPHLNLPSLLLPLESGAKFFENRSYGKPYTTGAGGLGGTQNLAPDVRDFAMDVAPYAPDVARLAGKGAKAIGKGVGEAMSQFAPSGSGPKTLTSQVGAIKPKGGNWLNNSVEERLYPLTKNVLSEQGIRNLGERQGQEVVDRYMEGHKKDVALNNWVNKNLTNYVKKEMGTPEDPVRKLAEEGILHSPMEAGRYRVPENIKQARFNAGFPIEGMGQSDLAKAWEHLSDASIKPQTVEQLINPRFQKEDNVNSNIYQAERNKANNPWLEKLDPKDVVHETRHPFSGLGFDHILDVLKEDITNGRLNPESLKNVSMEQAVRRTHEYDQEMAKKMAEAQFKVTEGMPVHKEYPEGYKWIELAPKEVKSKEDLGDLGLQAYFDYMKSGGNEAYALKAGQKADASKYLGDALKYEGDTMGHCVGGYCPDVLEGRLRIYSLRDAKGEPHVTIETRPNQARSKYETDWFSKQPEDVQNKITSQALAEHELSNANRTPEDDRFQWGQALSNAIKSYMGEVPEQIIQIKGKGNKRPVSKYDPFTQDFVKSGNWSDVGDLHNTGLVEQHSLDRQIAKDQFGLNLPRFTTPQESKDYMGLDVDRYHNGAENLKIPESLLKYKTQPEPTPEVPSEVPPIAPPETPQFKRGGKVHITDNLDTQWAETAFKPHMAGGGAISSLIDKALAKKSSKIVETAKSLGLRPSEFDAYNKAFTQIEEAGGIPRTMKDVTKATGKESDIARSMMTNPAYKALGEIPIPAMEETLAKRKMYRSEPRVTPGPKGTEKEWADWGAQHGVNMNLTPDVSLGISDLTTGREVKLPGGLEGTFTIPDLFKIKAQNIDPNALPKEVHDALMEKFIRTHKIDNPDQVDMFNRLNFALLSPNAPLTPNEFLAQRARLVNMDELKALANRKGEPNLSKTADVQLGVGAAGRGGMGVLGTADLGNQAMLAKLILDKPEMFQLQPGETMRDVTTRVMNQVPGLGPKTASLGTPWLDLAKANTSAVDLHMINNSYKRMLDDPDVGEAFRDRMAALLKTNPTTEDILKVDPKLVKDAAINVIGGTQQARMYRLKSGDLNNIPSVASPEKLAYEPKTFQDFNPFYSKVVDYVDESRGQHPIFELFPEQWKKWDQYRGRIEPHEFAHPDFRKLPRQSWSEMADALQAHKNAGYTQSNTPVMKEGDWRELYYGGGLPLPIIGGEALSNQGQPVPPKETNPITLTDNTAEMASELNKKLGGEVHMADGGGVPSMEYEPEQVPVDFYKHGNKMMTGDADISMGGMGLASNLGNDSLSLALNSSDIKKYIGDRQMMNALMANYAHNMDNTKLMANVMAPQGTPVKNINLMASTPVGGGTATLGAHGSHGFGQKQLNALSANYNLPLEHGNLNANVNRSLADKKNTVNLNYVMPFKNGGEVHMAGGGKVGLAKSAVEMMEEIMAKLGQKSIQNTSKIIPKETNYVTKQDGPFYRVTPKSISTSTSSNSGARQKIWGSDATNDTTTRREFGSRDTPLFSHEGLQEVINNNAENLPRNLANKKTQEIYGKDYQELAMPDSSLVKQAPIARAFMSGANNEEGYKNAIFNAYLEQHPELIEQTGSKNYDDLLKASYEQLAKETKDQFKSLPFNFSFHQGEGTYPNSASMNADVHGNNHIYVFQGGDKHDFLNEVDPETGLNTNEMFRAVHDIFGHGIHGNQFGPKGEEIAWGAHHQMYSPLAIPAMTAETRGQNSVVNYSPLNADIKSAVSALENRIIDAKRERNFEQAEKLTATKADLLTNQFRYAPQASVLLPPEMLKPEYSGGMPDYLKDVIKPDPETKYATSLYHFSHDPNLSLTNPEKYGTGIKGQEAERLEYSNAIKPRTYFYTDENVKPEVGLGSNRYKTQAEDLYNLQADPLNFFTLAKEANRQPFTAKYNAGVTPSPQSIANDVERLAKEYGYSGVVNPSLSKPAAAVFKPMDVEPYKIGGEVHLAGGGSASKALEAMLAEAPELANTIRGLFKAEAPTLGSLVDKLRTPDRQSVLPMPNRWFLDPENHPEVQGLVQKVLDVNGMNRSDFHSGAYVDPKTGKIIDTQIHKDVGVAIDPITNKPVMTTGGLTGMESLPKDQGSFTNSNLLKQGKYKPVGGDSILNDLGFIATVDKAGMGHAYGLGTDYASPVLLNNLGTGSNPTLRPRSVGDVFGIGDVVGQMQINKNSPVHDVYEKLLVAPKGSDVQGVKLSKKKGGKVQITNNPDTQWAELQFQRK